MLGPSIMIVSAPFAVGYAWATLRSETHRPLAKVALIVASTETAVLVYLLAQATVQKLA